MINEKKPHMRDSYEYCAHLWHACLLCSADRVARTVRITGGIHPRLPVKTDGALPRPLVREAVRLLDTVEVSSPVRCGQVILENIGGTGINFVASRDM